MKSLRLTLRFLWIGCCLGAFAWNTGDACAVDLLSENFNELALQQVETFQSEVRDRAAWTKNVPSGAGVQGIWSIDDSLMPPETTSDLIGAVEFEGWTFVDRDWWVDSAGDQDRSGFLSASGTIAVADPDEWDDFGSPQSPTSYGTFDSKLLISNIPLAGAAPNTARLFFHSSWRFEGNQKASLKVTYNDPAATTIDLFEWHSDIDSPNFHDDNVNETVNIPVLNPAGATNASLEFRLFDAGNNWWWAIDNLSMFTGTSPAQDGVLRLTIDRDTGAVKIANNTSETVNLRGYSIESLGGAFNQAAATYLGDSNSNWQVLGNPLAGDLSEGYIPNQYAMPTKAANATLGEISLGNAWEKNFQDVNDVTFRYLVAGQADPVAGIVEFVGNNGESFDALDLNFDGTISLADYAKFLSGYNTSLVGKTSIQAYNLGDLDRNGVHSVNDFLEFKRRFNQLRGAGAFESLIAASSAVPEPSSAAILLAMIGLTAAGSSRRFQRGTHAAVVLALVGGMVMASSANAALPLLVEDFESLPLGQNPEEQPQQSGVWTDVAPSGWTLDRSAMPGLGDPANDGVRDWAGWTFADKDWWVGVAGDQRRSEFSRGVGTVMIADPDEWDDATHAAGLFNTTFTSPVITIPAGIPAGKIKLAFDSSWRPEGFDDGDGQNNQTATVDYSYNGGAFQNRLTWDSEAGGSNFHEDQPNEAVELDLNYNGSSTTLQLRFGLGKAANDWWWAVDNIRVFVPSDPAVVRINTTTGFAEILGGDVITETINGYDITSANGNLSPSGALGLSSTKPNSVDGPDADSIVGNNIGESWQLGSANANQFSEFFLDGSSDFTASRMENLGKIFNPSVAAANRDVEFTYTTIFGDVVEGVVEYVSTSANADFNGNGRVEGGDFLSWQRGFRSGTTLAQGDADGDGDVDGVDYAIWSSRFGQSASSSNGSAVAAAVPEPTGALLAMLTGGIVMMRRPRKLWEKQLAICLAPCMAIGACVVERADAQSIPAPFVDRDYRFGDNDPSAANGANVAITRDNAGATGMNQLIDLAGNTRAGGPAKYVSITGRPDGGTGLGIALNPNPTDKQYLRTGVDEALNFPERSPSSTEGTLDGGTIDYLFITDRGFQLWVKPTATTDSFIVMDSNNHGALIGTDGKFGMRYSNADYAGKTSVVANEWYHLMVVRAFGDRGTGSVLYVNGVAEAASVGIYNGENAPNDEMNPANHDNSPLVIGSTTSESPFQVGTQKYFHGVIDDLSMFVMGLNNTRDFGEFSLKRDNAYVAHFAPSVEGDLTGDGLITMADVDLFAENWRYENRLEWTQGGVEQSLLVGDLSSRSRGDYNYDGRVDLADWGVLNTVNPAMAAAAMALITAVPEPGSMAIALAAAVGCVGGRSRRRSN